MDSFTETSSQGWLSRLMGSIKGVLTGLLLFIIAFPLLFWNEGRAVKRAKDLAEGRGAVISVSADKVEAGNDGQLVHMTGMATTEDDLGDPQFKVTSEDTLALSRVVEMYQWQQNEKKETTKRAGGKTETTTTYSYEKVWSPTVINSSGFKKPEGHQNPGSMAFQSEEQRADKVTIGAFDLGSLASSINNWEKLPVDAKLDINAGRPLRNVDGGYYFGKDAGNPEIGDLKINFKVIKPQTVSIVAVQKGDTFTEYKGSSGSTIFRLETGEHSADDMFTAMESENTMILWILRVVGFLLMMGGITAIFKPLVVVADVIPFVGDLLEWGLGLLAFCIAAPLTLITIAIGWIFYRPLIGIALLVVAVAIIAGGISMAKKRKA